MDGGRILLTGAAGFVGRAVMARATDHGATAVPFEGDVRDDAAVSRSVADTAPDAVVHLASRRPTPTDPWAALADEVAMAGNLLRALRASAPEATLLVAGSAAQYGRALPHPVDESAPLSPLSAYGAVKCAVERSCTDAVLNGGTRVIWARTFNCLGPGQPTSTPAADWAHQIAQAELSGGGVVRTGDVSVVRDFLDVRDVADAYLALLRSDLAGPVNVGSGTPTPLHELAALFAERATVDVTLERDPALGRSDDPPYVVADVARLTAATGWHPTMMLARSVDDMLAEARAAASATTSAGSGA